MGTVFFEVKVEHVEHSLAALEIHFFLTIPTTAQSVQKGRPIKMTSFNESLSGVLN